jgi:hypothetical protein
MIEINRNPSKKELGWFGLLALLFFGLVGTTVYRHFHSVTAMRAIWAVGAVGAAIYYILPMPGRRRVYVGWMTAAYPIGWTVSNVAMIIVFYGVLTPIGLTMRLCGRDPLTRALDRNAATYWVEHDPSKEGPERYFRQS